MPGFYNSRRLVRWIGGALLAVVLLWLVPLIRITPLGEQAAHASEAFDAADLAAQLWTDTLPAAVDEANHADEVLAAIAADPVAAGERYGRVEGVSRGYYLLLRGVGTIVSVERLGVAVALDDDSEADILLQTGPIFGNAVRDGADLIDAGDVANSQEFNRVSEQLNRLVEERVVPALRSGAAEGKRVEFVGCAEVKNPQRFTKPLKLVPVSVHFE